MVLFFGLVFSVAPWKIFCRRPCLEILLYEPCVKVITYIINFEPFLIQNLYFLLDYVPNIPKL